VLAAALAVGVVFMSVIYLMMRMLMSLRADGTLDYRNAVGQTGRVYVTIPALRGGEGQIEILIQGRLTTVHAVTDSPGALAPQTSVRVSAVENGNILVVSPTH
jgi:membrane protein implicated in regulation of membrane protease activity